MLSRKKAEVSLIVRAVVRDTLRRDRINLSNPFAIRHPEGGYYCPIGVSGIWDNKWPTSFQPLTLLSVFKIPVEFLRVVPLWIRTNSTVSNTRTRTSFSDEYSPYGRLVVKTTGSSQTHKHTLRAVLMTRYCFLSATPVRSNTERPT